MLPATWSHGNPVDILGDAGADRYQGALKALLADRQVDAVFVLNCPVGVADSLEAAKAVVAALAGGPRIPVIACWVGDSVSAEPRRLLIENKLPSYETPDEGVQAFMHLVSYHRNQQLLMETPPASAEALPERNAVV